MRNRALNQSTANSLRNRVLALVAKEGFARLELAEALYELYYGVVEVGGGELPLYKFFGHSSWFEYVETEVGLHVSTAAGYRLVHDVFGIKLRGAWDTSLTQSFTKLKALARVVNERNVNAWLKKAQRLSCCALEEEIAEHLTGRRRRGAHRHFTALLTDRQLARANAILHQAADQFPDGSWDSRGELLLRILEQWSSAVRSGGRHLKVVKGAG